MIIKKETEPVWFNNEIRREIKKKRNKQRKKSQTRAKGRQVVGEISNANMVRETEKKYEKKVVLEIRSRKYQTKMRNK